MTNSEFLAATDWQLQTKDIAGHDSMSKRFYITTSIMYTNARPHIGFVLELVQADVIARYRSMMGDEIRFLTGTDEHGTKIARAAEAAGMEPQLFVDDIAAQVQELTKQLNISNTDFIRTTDRERHWPSVRKLWAKLADNDDLYKKTYKGYYCVGHEAFIKPSELVDNRCPLHKTPIEEVEEENWFFRLTKYKKEVKELIESDALLIVPETRKKEVLNLLDDAEDVSFSRPSQQLSWGIPVPGDESQTMYVWADALTNYLSALGFAENSGEFKDFWPADVHLVGKDILRFHAMIWPAMLLAADIPTPRAVYVHGFMNVDGQKMSKSLGNVVEPHELLTQYDSEVVRYYLLREIPSTDDGDFSWKNVERRYESDLANGLGNLVQRVIILWSKMESNPVYQESMTDTKVLARIRDDSHYHEAMNKFRLHEATAHVWDKIAETNAYINLHEPWKQEGEDRERTLMTATVMIHHTARILQPMMPETSAKIATIIGLPLGEEITEGSKLNIRTGGVLFPRRA